MSKLTNQEDLRILKPKSNFSPAVSNIYESVDRSEGPKSGLLPSLKNVNSNPKIDLTSSQEASNSRSFFRSLSQKLNKENSLTRGEKDSNINENQSGQQTPSDSPKSSWIMNEKSRHRDFRIKVSSSLELFELDKALSSEVSNRKKNIIPKNQNSYRSSIFQRTNTTKYKSSPDDEPVPLGIKLLSEKKSKTKSTIVRRDLMDLSKSLERQTEIIMNKYSNLKPEEMLAILQNLFDESIETFSLIISKECMDYRVMLKNIWELYSDMRQAWEFRLRRVMQQEIEKLQALLNDLEAAMKKKDDNRDLMVEKVEKAQEVLRLDSLMIMNQSLEDNSRQIHRSIDSQDLIHHGCEKKEVLPERFSFKDESPLHNRGHLIQSNLEITTKKHDAAYFLNGFLHESENPVGGNNEDSLEKEVSRVSPTHSIRKKYKDAAGTQPIGNIHGKNIKLKKYHQGSEASSNTQDAGSDTRDLIEKQSRGVYTKNLIITEEKCVQYDLNDVALESLNQNEFLCPDLHEISPSPDERTNTESLLKIYLQHIPVEEGEDIVQAAPGEHYINAVAEASDKEPVSTTGLKEKINLLYEKALDMAGGVGTAGSEELLEKINNSKTFLDYNTKLIQRTLVRQEISLEEAKLEMIDKENLIEIWKRKHKKLSSFCDSLENHILKSKKDSGNSGNISFDKHPNSEAKLSKLRSLNIFNDSEKKEGSSRDDLDMENKINMRKFIRRITFVSKVDSEKGLVEQGKEQSENSQNIEEIAEDEGSVSRKLNLAQDELGGTSMNGIPFINMKFISDKAEMTPTENQGITPSSKISRKKKILNKFQKRNSVVASSSVSPPKKGAVISPSSLVSTRRIGKETERGFTNNEGFPSTNHEETEVGNYRDIFPKFQIASKTVQTTLNQADSVKLLDSLRNMSLQAKEETPLLSILKTISSLYTELVKKKERNIGFFFGKFYDFMLTRMGGNRSFTESKILQLIRSCLFHSKIPKLRVFLRLLAISNNQTLEEENCHYFEMMDFLDETNPSSNSGLGISICSQESCTVPYSKAIDYLNAFCSKKDILSYISKDILLNEIKQLKSFDSVQIRKSVVDFDSLAEIFLNANLNMFEKKYLHAFKAVDVEKTNMIPFEVFYFCLTNSEFSISKEAVKVQFDSHAHMYNDITQTKQLTFPRFVELCELIGFRPLRMTESEISKQYQDLIWIWEEKRDTIKLQLLRSKNYTIFHKKLMSSIDENLSLSDPPSREVILTRLRLLERSRKALTLLEKQES